MLDMLQSPHCQKQNILVSLLRISSVIMTYWILTQFKVLIDFGRLEDNQLYARNQRIQWLKSIVKCINLHSCTSLNLEYTTHHNRFFSTFSPHTQLKPNFPDKTLFLLSGKFNLSWDMGNQLTSNTISLPRILLTPRHLSKVASSIGILILFPLSPSVFRTMA